MQVPKAPNTGVDAIVAPGEGSVVMSLLAVIGLVFLAALILVGALVLVWRSSPAKPAQPAAGALTLGLVAFGDSHRRSSSPRNAEHF